MKTYWLSGGTGDLVAACAFRPIEGRVGPGEKRKSAPAYFVGDVACTDGYVGNGLRMGARLDGPAQAFGCIERFPLVAIGQQPQELLAPDPADKIPVPRMAQRDMGYPDKHLVANCMAILVIQILEVVDIEHDH